jgi:hypothetical protein
MIKVFESVGEPADFLDDEVDRFSAAIADAVGVELSQDLGFPGAHGTAQPGDLGNGTGVKAVQDLDRDLPAFGRYGVVDGAQPLVALPGKINFTAGVAGVEEAADLVLLALGQVLDTIPQQPTDLIERVVFVAAAA